MLVLAHLHRSVLTQQVHSLGHLAFKWRSSFAKALAKLSPNFREKSPNSFYKMIHIYIINTKYKYLQCKIRHVYMNFRQNFRQKKITFAISEKTLAETVHYIPKGLRKGNPFHGPFAQLSCTTKGWEGRAIREKTDRQKQIGGAPPETIRAMLSPEVYWSHSSKRPASLPCCYIGKLTFDVVAVPYSTSNSTNNWSICKDGRRHTVCALNSPFSWSWTPQLYKAVTIHHCSTTAIQMLHALLPVRFFVQWLWICHLSAANTPLDRQG